MCSCLFAVVVRRGGGETSIYRDPKALSILMSGRSSGEEPPLRHPLRWADELQLQGLLRFLPLVSFCPSPPPPVASSPSRSGCVLPYCVKKEGDPASLLTMETPPQPVTSKRGHCSSCDAQLLIWLNNYLLVMEARTLICVCKEMVQLLLVLCMFAGSEKGGRVTCFSEKCSCFRQWRIDR